MRKYFLDLRVILISTFLLVVAVLLVVGFVFPTQVSAIGLCNAGDNFPFPQYRINVYDDTTGIFLGFVDTQDYSDPPSPNLFKSITADITVPPLTMLRYEIQMIIEPSSIGSVYYSTGHTFIRNVGAPIPQTWPGAHTTSTVGGTIIGDGIRITATNPITANQQLQIGGTQWCSGDSPPGTNLIFNILTTSIPRIDLTETQQTFTCFGGPCLDSSWNVGVINSGPVSTLMNWVGSPTSDPNNIIVSLNGALSSGTGLAGGQTAWGSYTFRQPSLTPNTYYATFRETCLLNCEPGFTYKDYNITYIVEPAPNYTVDSLATAPAGLLVGQLVTFSGRVTNVGTGPALISSKTRARLDINNDGTWDTTLTPDQDTTALALGGNETATWSTAWTAVAGTHRFEVCADAIGNVPESQPAGEGDNCAQQTFSVGLPPSKLQLSEIQSTFTCFSGPCANGTHTVFIINGDSLAGGMQWFGGIINDPYNIIVPPLHDALADDGGVPLPGGQTRSGYFEFQQPTTTPGTYQAQFRLDCNPPSSCQAGFQSVIYTLTYIVEPINDAQFISQTIPSLITAGQTAPVSVTMRNCHPNGVCNGGDLNTWYGEASATPYRLGAQDPLGNNFWGLSRANMSSGAGFSRTPGQSFTFNFNITAPNCIVGQPGCTVSPQQCTAISAYRMNCNFRWSMIQENIEWFGQCTTPTTDTADPDCSPPSQTIEVKANEPPVVSNITATYIPCSTASNTATIGWTYTDPDGDPQSAWRIELADDAFGSWVSLYDTGIVPGSGTSQTITWGVAPRNKTIKVRVTVWDSGTPVLASAPLIQNGIFFALVHDAPRPDFCWPETCGLPATRGAKPKVNLPTAFTDRSQCYDSNGLVVACRRWSWNFGDANPPPSVDSTLQNPTHTYLNIASYNVNLITEDNDGYACSLSKPIRIERPIPIWKEISPGE